ncbi:hypothetical protein NX865_30760, partial [Burkholderia thailandensis]|uniref:hypothetical protein n=1 Tax=Burkholderia thailandensis TaxID=57975 RepID=UPI00217DA7B1
MRRGARGAAGRRTFVNMARRIIGNAPAGCAIVPIGRLISAHSSVTHALNAGGGGPAVNCAHPKSC